MNGDWYDVDELVRQIAAVIYAEQFGLLTVTGLLTDWTTHRGGASGQLAHGDAHLRLYADRHTARTLNDRFTDAGHDSLQPAAVVTRGQLTMHPRWGLRLQLFGIDLEAPPTAAEIDTAVNEANKARSWPHHINVIGLVDPAHGDAGRADLLDVLADYDLTIIEHRVPVTGRHAPGRIARALDQLANDHRPDVTVIIRGGGPGIDLDVFNHPHVLAAIARHPRPIVAGIGHASDHTHTDAAVHTTCITPTAAAQHLARSATQEVATP